LGIWASSFYERTKRTIEITECYITETGLKVIIKSNNSRKIGGMINRNTPFYAVIYFFNDDGPSLLEYYEVNIAEHAIDEQTGFDDYTILELKCSYKTKIYTNQIKKLSIRNSWGGRGDLYANIFIKDPYGEEGSCYESPFTMYNDFEIEILKAWESR